MGTTLLLDPSFLHEQLWRLLNKHPVNHFIDSMYNREKITLDMVTSTIRSMFKSNHKGSFADNVTVLSEVVDRDKLYEYAVKQQLFAVEKKVVVDRDSKDIDNCTREVILYPPVEEIVYSVFHEEIEQFHSLLFQTIVSNTTKDKDLFYRFIEFDAAVDRRGRICSLKLLIGDDVRHAFFKSIFGRGNYDPAILEKLELPEIDTGFRYNRSNGMVSFEHND